MTSIEHSTSEKAKKVVENSRTEQKRLSGSFMKLSLKCGTKQEDIEIEFVDDVQDWDGYGY